MLLTNKKFRTILLSTLSIFLLSSCAGKKSQQSYSYSGNSYKSNKVSSQKYKKIPKEKIRNSKAMHRATMRPYKIAGKWYHPTSANVGDQLKGIASWYGPNFHAKKTSNGEVYNMYALTAAHKTLPMNTIVKVINLENNKSIIVRVNDRGPFVSGRIIDLSNKAAYAIDMVKKGTAKVKVLILGFNAKIENRHKEKKDFVKINSYFLQVGAFSQYNGALNVKRKFNLILENNYKAIIKQTNNKELNKVWISGFKSLVEVENFKINNNLDSSLIIVQ